MAIYTGGNLDDALKNIAFHDRSLLDSSDLHVHYPEATITQYPDAHACIDAIKAGKATCMIMTVTGLDTLRNEVDLGNLVTAEMPKSIELACWLRQGDAQLLSIVNKGIVSAADDIAASAYSHYSYSDGHRLRPSSSSTTALPSSRHGALLVGCHRHPGVGAAQCARGATQGARGQRPPKPRSSPA